MNSSSESAPFGTNSLRTIGLYYLRAGGYGAISIAALWAGVLSTPDRVPGQALLLMLLNVISVCFAFGFALCFHDNKYNPEQLPTITLENIIALFTLVIAVFVSYFVLQRYVTLYGIPSNPLPAVVAISSYSAGFTVYCIYLLKRFRRSSGAPIRHRLIYPSMLAVAVNFYYGTHFVQLFTSFWPLVPLVVLCIYLAASAGLPRRAFRNASSFLLVTAIVLVGLQKFKLVPAYPWNDYPATLLFAVALAAYIGVFEAWHITAQRGHTLTETELEQWLAAGTPAGDYYVSSLIALAASIWLMPLFYVFANVGLTFLSLFALHALVAIYIWTQVCAIGKDLQSINWIVMKNVAGFALLALPVADFFRPWRVSTQVPYYVAAFLTALAFPATINFLVVALRADDHWKETFWDTKGLLTLFSKRRNACRIVALAAWLPMAFLFICQAATTDTNSLFFAKVGPAFIAYVTIIALALLVELVTCKPQRPPAACS